MRNLDIVVLTGISGGAVRKNARKMSITATSPSRAAVHTPRSCQLVGAYVGVQHCHQLDRASWSALSGRELWARGLCNDGYVSRPCRYKGGRIATPTNSAHHFHGKKRLDRAHSVCASSCCSKQMDLQYQFTEWLSWFQFTYLGPSQAWVSSAHCCLRIKARMLIALPRSAGIRSYRWSRTGLWCLHKAT